MSPTYLRLLRATAIPRNVSEILPAPNPPDGPDDPTDLVATAIGPTQVDLTWISNSAANTTFHIRRGLGPGPGSTDPLADVPNNGTTYSDFEVEPGTQYFYTVWAETPEGASGTAISPPVTTPSEGVTLEPDFYQPLGGLVEDNSYDLRSRVLNPDQTIHTPYAVNDWDFTLPSGGPGAIVGPDDDILTIFPGVAPDSIEVRASYVGAETLSPSFQDKVFGIVASGGPFPENEPPDMDTILFLNGSNKSPPGWNQGDAWQDNNRVAIVNDPDSKYGQAIEKRFFIGDQSGWHGLIHRQIGLWEELYFRFVFKLSQNWQYHGGTNSKMVYYNRSGGGQEEILWGERYAWSDSPSAIFPSQSEDSLKSGRQIPVPPGSETGNPQQGTNIPRNVYHTLEIHHVASLTPGTGALRLWIDGVEHTTFKKLGGGETGTHSLIGRTDASTVNQGDKRIGRAVEMPLFWGGSGLTKTVNDWIRMSEIYISGKN